jgi:indolepyruvate ferredoxin oxidoreductase
VVAASKDAIVLCDPDRTEAVLNTRVTPVSDFIRHRDFDFRTPQVEASVAGAVRSTGHFRNFSALAQRLTGDEIGANLMMLGYAWQSGLVPLSGASILQAIALNGTAVKANTDAFNWGRLLAQNPARVDALAGAAPASEPLSLNALIDRRAAHLAAYQNTALAKRYRAGLAPVLAAAECIGAADLSRIAAETYAKVLAYKDEYEVARLYSAPAFRAGLEAEFSGDYRIALNLAPPILPGKTANGRPRKREFGPWVLPVLRLLARMKPLRGTWADPFGYSNDRKLERALIARYEADLALAAKMLTAGTLPTLRELLSLPQDIRGYGPVKDAAFRLQTGRRDQLRAALQDKTAAALAAE